MNKLQTVQDLRKKLSSGEYSLGSWIQIPSSSIAEIMGQAGYDWIAVDMEHGSISVHQLPDIFRSLELGNTLPLVRIAQGRSKDCKLALDAGAAGVIVPMIENADQLKAISDAIRWPPAGSRGVAFSRANLFGKNFNNYSIEAQQPLLVAMIENINAVDNINSILQVKGLDAILIGPYDLSASIDLTAKFNHSDFISLVNKIKNSADSFKVPCGIHVVSPSIDELNKRISEGYRFLPYSIDSVFLNHSAKSPY